MLGIHNAQVTYTNKTLKSGGELQKPSGVFNSQQHIDLCENTRDWSGKAGQETPSLISSELRNKLIKSTQQLKSHHQHPAT